MLIKRRKTNSYFMVHLVKNEFVPMKHVLPDFSRVNVRETHGKTRVKGRKNPRNRPGDPQRK